MFNNPDNREENTEEIPTSGEYRYTAQNNPGASAGGNYNPNQSGSYSEANRGYNANPTGGYSDAANGYQSYNNYNNYNNAQQSNDSGYHSPNYHYDPNQGGGQYPPYGQQPPMGNSSRRKKTPKPPKPPKPPRNHAPMSTVKLVALMLVCALVGGLVGGGAMYAVSETGIIKPTATVAVSDRSEAATLTTEPVKAGKAMDSAQIYKTNSDSVVCITVETKNGTGAGTGFIISEDGYILTCDHVVDDATAISVTLNNTESYEAKLVGSDSDQDVAVIKVDPGESKLKAVTLGKSSLLGVGDSVTVIGNALGTLANTLTTGVVSALDRAITMSDGTVMRLMQTDCTINSGNSGGPLFNQYGEVVGIVNAKYSSSAYDQSTASIEGIGFAIPMDTVNDILSDLMEHGYVTGKPYLGVTVSTISSVTAQQYKNMVVGAYINSVETGSCAEKAGLQKGDIITQVDGTDITSSAELIDAKNAHKAGEEMKLTVYRPDENSDSAEANYVTMVVTLDEQQPKSEEEQDSNNQQQGGSDYDYGYGYGNNGGNGGNSYGYGGFGGFGWPFGFGGW